LRTPKATADTPKADYTDVEGINHLMKKPKPKAPVVEIEEVPEKMVEEHIPETSIEIADSTEEVGNVEDIVVVPQVCEQQPLAIEEEISPKENEVEKEVVELRRGNRGTRTPKTATPKIPSKRTPTEQEELPVEEKESECAKVPTDEVPEECAKVQSETELIEEEKAVGASALKRGRRAATAKTSTPKADYRVVSGVKRLLRTPKAAPGNPKADYSDVEGAHRVCCCAV
jgi:antigen KI-67